MEEEFFSINFTDFGMDFNAQKESINYGHVPQQSDFLKQFHGLVNDFEFTKVSRLRGFLSTLDDMNKIKDFKGKVFK